MNKNNLRCALALGFAVAGALSIASCGESDNASALPDKAANPVELATDNLFESERVGHALDIGTYHKLDENAALEAMVKKYGKNMKKSGCTAVVKDRSEKGDYSGDKGLLIGRNMDLSMSDKPLYKFNLDINKYKAIGIAYSPYSGPSYQQVKAGALAGASKEYATVIPATGSDFFNEKGLYIEMNMRNHDYRGTGEGFAGKNLFGCTGTNPGKGKPDVFLCAVPMYVSTRCATVFEVLEMIQNDLNIFTGIKSDESDTTLDWNFAFVCGDATGNYGLIEFAQNRIYYTAFTGQANFYQAPALAKQEIYSTGGCKSVDYHPISGKPTRYTLANEGAKAASTVAEMRDGMHNVFYSQLYATADQARTTTFNKYGSSKFDKNFEMVAALPLDAEGNMSASGSVFNATTAQMIQKDYTSDIEQYFVASGFAGKTADQIADSNLDDDKTNDIDYWITSQCVVTDIGNRKMHCQFFESTSQASTHTFGFDF